MEKYKKVMNFMDNEMNLSEKGSMIYISGKSGFGKSTLVTSIFANEIKEIENEFEIKIAKLPLDKFGYRKMDGVTTSTEDCIKRFPPLQHYIDMHAMREKFTTQDIRDLGKYCHIIGKLSWYIDLERVLGRIKWHLNNQKIQNPDRPRHVMFIAEGTGVNEKEVYDLFKILFMSNFSNHEITLLNRSNLRDYIEKKMKEQFFNCSPKAKFSESKYMSDAKRHSN